jgi:membrane protease YdiL (CAAX protease family)
VLDIRQVTPKQRIALIPLLLLGGLLIIRFPIVIGVKFALLPITYEQMVTILFDGSYVLAAILIWCERERLSEFHLGLGSLLIFVVTPLAKPIIYKILNPYVPYRLTFSWVQIVVSLSLVMALLVGKTPLRAWKIDKMIIWSAIGISVGLFVGVGNGYLASLQTPRTSTEATLPLLAYLFVTQLSNAAIAEEPLFRGFLWGYLRHLNWKEHWVWLFQAGLFMLGHIYYFNQYPLSFWVIVPFDALILGLLAWKSRSIGTSMISHGLFNSVADIVAHMKW